MLKAQYTLEHFIFKKKIYITMNFCTKTSWVPSLPPFPKYYKTTHVVKNVGFDAENFDPLILGG